MTHALSAQKYSCKTQIHPPSLCRTHEFCQTVDLMIQYTLSNGKPHVLQLRNYSMCDMNHGGHHLNNSCDIFWPSTPLPEIYVTNLQQSAR